MSENILSIKDLVIHYETQEEVVEAVNKINLDLNKGEILGLVGETGAGKTTTALGIMGLLPPKVGHVIQGNIFLEGEDLLKKSQREMRSIRGKKISMIFQDPMTALNPVETVGYQIAEAIKQHNKISKLEAMDRAGDMLEMVGIPRGRYGEYPHQFSGGMKQRVVIAMALACNPALLLADEPTTALDVTIQAQVLDMMRDLKKQLGTSVVLITHDFGVVANFCETVAVTYAGEIVERGSVDQVFNNTKHPYTEGLFNSLPSLDAKTKRLKPIKGLMPDPTVIPAGCRFCDRCEYATEECANVQPEVYEVAPGHLVKCHRAKEVSE